jgi:hypothetical protein
MCKVAIVDDGINTSQLFVNNFMFNTIVRNGAYNSIIAEYKAATGELSHGSICGAIVSKYAPNSEIYGIVVQNNSRRTTVDRLIAAYSVCARLGINIISLSMGATSVEGCEELLRAVNNAYYKHRIITVAATDNYGLVTYPASFANVIAVASDDNLQEDEIKQCEHAADGVNVLACSDINLPLRNGLRYRTPVTNSFASPVVAGMIAAKWNLIGDKTIPKIKNILNLLATNKKEPILFNRENTLDWIHNPCVIVHSEPNDRFSELSRLIIVPFALLLHDDHISAKNIMLPKYSVFITVNMTQNFRLLLLSHIKRHTRCGNTVNWVAHRVPDDLFAVDFSDFRYFSVDEYKHRASRKQITISTVRAKTQFILFKNAESKIRYLLSEIEGSDGRTVFVSDNYVDILYGIEYVPIDSNFQNNSYNLLTIEDIYRPRKIVYLIDDISTFNRANILRISSIFSSYEIVDQM